MNQYDDDLNAIRTPIKQVLADMEKVPLPEPYDGMLPAAVPNAEDFVRMLLWDEFPECCGRPVVGAEYMGQQEMLCCGCPEPALLSDAQIVASLRERFPEARGIEPEGRESEGPRAKPEEPGPEWTRPEDTAQAQIKPLVEALQGMCDVWRSVCTSQGWEPSHMVQYRQASELLALHSKGA